jgi:hypothetical protein
MAPPPGCSQTDETASSKLAPPIAPQMPMAIDWRIRWRADPTGMVSDVLFTESMRILQMWVG